MTTDTTTSAATVLMQEMQRDCAATAAQSQRLMELIEAMATSCAPAVPAVPAPKMEGRIIYNPARTRRVRHAPPPKDCKMSGTDSRWKPIHTCASCTQN